MGQTQPLLILSSDAFQKSLCSERAGPSKTREIGAQTESLHRRQPAQGPQPRVTTGSARQFPFSLDLSLPNKKRRSLGKTTSLPTQRPVLV